MTKIQTPTNPFLQLLKALAIDGKAYPRQRDRVEPVARKWAVLAPPDAREVIVNGAIVLDLLDALL